MSTLIIYATKHGAAKKCAVMLWEKLSGKVDLCNIREEKVPELTQYDKVVIGGSIYAGTLQKQIREFCNNNLEVLKNKKVGLFICCMNQKEAEKQLNAVYPKELLNMAAAKESFGGEFKFKDMNFLEKLVTKVVSKALAKDDPSLKVDTTKDLSMLSMENIEKFAKLI